MIKHQIGLSSPKLLNVFIAFWNHTFQITENGNPHKHGPRHIIHMYYIGLRGMEKVVELFFFLVYSSIIYKDVIGFKLG